MTRLLPLVALLGCTAEPEPAEPLAYDATDYVVPDDTTAEPAMALSDIETALSDVLPMLPELSSSPALDAYLAAMEGAEEDCPTWYIEAEGSYWYDYCYTEAGDAYEGYVYEATLYDYADPYNVGWVWDIHEVAASATVLSGGHFFSGSGSLSMTTGTGPDGASGLSTYVGGTFTWDGPEADDTWMADGVRPSLYMWQGTFPIISAHDIYLEGSITGLGGTADTVALTEVYIASRSAGWPCAEEPQGTISLRGDEGYWYDVIFDPYEVCDGCGEVWFRGDRLGEACVDLSDWVAWEGK